MHQNQHHTHHSLAALGVWLFASNPLARFFLLILAWKLLTP